MEVAQKKQSASNETYLYVVLATNPLLPRHVVEPNGSHPPQLRCRKTCHKRTNTTRKSIAVGSHGCWGWGVGNVGLGLNPGGLEEVDDSTREG